MPGVPEHVLERWTLRAADIGKAQEKYHNANHCWPQPRAYDDCWLCGRLRAICKSKVRFSSIEEAVEVCDKINFPSRDRLIIPYICRWGPGLHFHNRTAKSSNEVRRARKHMSRRLRA